MKKSITLIIASALALAACGQAPQQNAANNSAPATSAASSAELSTGAAPAVEPTVLTSKDNAFRFNPDASFADKSSESSLQPQGVAADSITLLQYDENRNLTLTAVQNGKAKGEVPALLGKIKTQLQGDKALSNVVIDDTADRRIDYRFVRKDKDQNIAESCFTVVASDNSIATICASSSDMSLDDVHDFLTRTVKVGA